MSANSNISPPPPGDDLDPDLFVRHWLGETSPTETARVEEWFRAHPEQREWYASFGSALKNEGYPRRSGAEWQDLAIVIRQAAREGNSVATKPGLDGAAERNSDEGRVFAFPQMTAGESATVAGPATVKKLFKVWPTTRLVSHSFRRAAGLGAALGAAILATGIGIGVSRTHWPVTPQGDGTKGVVPPNEVVTGRSQRATVNLTDGSRVILGVDSRMRYPRDFGKQSRDIELEGEAYFDVVHDSRVPFRVRTAHGISEDVGTRFAVRAYAGERATRVVVEEGLVAIGHGVTLAAGDLALVTPSTTPTVQHGVPIPTLLSWVHGNPRYVNVPLREVLADVRRWYDIDVTLADERLGDAPVNASFGKTPVTEVLDALASAANARLERHANRWLLVPNVQPLTRHMPSTLSHSGPGATDAR